MNLYSKDYTDVAVRVLGWEAVLQARQFAGMNAAELADEQLRFESVVKAARKLRSAVVERGSPVN